MSKTLEEQTVEELVELLAYHERVKRIPTTTLATYNAADEGARAVRAELTRRKQGSVRPVKHEIHDATPDEMKEDCCGDRYPCNVRYVCACGRRACYSCMRNHAFELLRTAGSR